MSTIGNIIWLIFGGFLSGLAYILGGTILCLTIIGIPFGWANIKLGFASFTPFGKELYTNPEADGCLNTVMNVLWLVVFGWEIAILHLIHAAILTVTIIGIPFAKQHIKLIPMSLLPFGRSLVRPEERNR